MFAGDPQPDQGRVAGGAVVRAGAGVGETGEEAGGLAERAQRRAPGRGHRPAGPQVVHDLPGGGGGLVVEELPVDHHHRGVVAGRVALDALERHPAVVGGTGPVEPQVVMQVGVDLVAAHHRAQCVCAHPDQVVARGRASVHRVERGDGHDLGGGESDGEGTELDAGGREVPVLGLDEVQEWQQRRPGLRIAGDDHLGVGPQSRQDVVGVVPAGVGPDDRPRLVRLLPELQEDRFATRRLHAAHRSTPPITGSMLATEAMTSESIPPSHIAATACRLVNDGSR